MLLQAFVSILATGTVFWAFRRHGDADPLKLHALFFACSAAATPYLMGYDTLPLAFSAIALTAYADVNALGRRLAQLAYWLLFLQIGFASLHIPGPALVPIALAALLALDIGGIRLSGRAPLTEAAA
jgi:hypothetical protein